MSILDTIYTIYVNALAINFSTNQKEYRADTNYTEFKYILHTHY